MWPYDDDEEPGLLTISESAGPGQKNDPEDVFATDNAMREAEIYSPGYPYNLGPARYLHEPMVDAIEDFQKRNGLKVDGYLDPGGPTERAINNQLLRKPSGAGLLYEPIAPIDASVGSGMENRREDVRSIQRSLGALGLIPEDPFDDPHGFLDERTNDSLRRFQESNGLRVDGWAEPGGETEQALQDGIADLVRASGREWMAFADRAGRAQADLAKKLPFTPGSARVEDLLRTLEQRPDDASRLEIIPLQGRGAISRLVPPGTSSFGESDSEPPVLPLPLPPFLDRAVPPPDQDEIFHKTEVLPFITATADELRDFKEATPRRIGETLDWMIIERKGNETTRAHNELIKDTIQKVASNHRCGGGHTGGSRTRDKDDPTKVEEKKETYLRPRGAPKGERAGSSYADITFTIKHNGRRLFINTYDIANRALNATARETGNAIRLLYNARRGDILLMIPKLLSGQSPDLDALQQLVDGLLDEMCEPPPEGQEQHTDRSMLEGLIRFFKDIQP